jgi:hypothetical protein
MSQILSVGLLAICTCLLAAHFIEIKKSRKQND